MTQKPDVEIGAQHQVVQRLPFWLTFGDKNENWGIHA